MTRARSPFSQRLYDRYSLKKEIGRGAFSRVFLAKDLETFEQVAIKVVDKQKMAKHGLSIEDEVKMMRMARHENVISLYDTIEDERHYFMILE
jgi:serine/threonine protein kinase